MKYIYIGLEVKHKVWARPEYVSNFNIIANKSIDIDELAWTKRHSIMEEERTKNPVI